MSSPSEIRVLRIINRFNLGGPTFNVAYLTRYLGAPFTTKLIGGAKDDSEASSEFILDAVGLTPEVIPAMQRSISPVDDWRAYQAIIEIIKAYRPHIVHTHASKSGTLGRIAAYHCGVPVIVHTFHGHVFHSYFGPLKTALYKRIERWLAKRSTRIIAISALQQKELGEDHKIAPLENIEVVPLGFDLSRFQEQQVEKRNAFRSKYGLEDDQVAIGIVGRLVPIKYHEMFLEGIREVMRTQPQARFFVVGDGERKEELTAMCDKLSIGHVHQEAPSHAKPLCFTSWIKEVDNVMAGLDIVCLTSLNEGTPVSLIEAQSAGKPVISTRVGGVEDIVNDGETGLLCEVHDTKHFTEHLVTLTSDKQKRNEMGQAGQQHVTERYSYMRLVADIHSLYLRLLEEKGISV